MNKIKYGSVCSGIEAASVAWDVLGWKAAWFAEIEAFPSAVLAHHWPHVQNLGDMTKIRDRISEGEVEAPDVLVGGTPCQAFSVAGARKSLDDDRGQLTLEYVRLANAIDEKREEPCIIVWENVPGVLNTKDNAFGCFLGALAGESSELQPAGGRWSNAGVVFGPQRAIAWRILDAQYFGVAQRRRRVFVVASARKGFNPAKVLFEWEGVRRDIAPSRSAGQETTGSAGSSAKNPSGFRMTAFGQYSDDETASTMKQRDYKDATDWVVAVNDDSPKLYDAYQHHGWREWGTCGTLTVGQNNTVRGDTPLIQQAQTFGIPGNWIGRKPENGGNATEPMNNIAPCQTRTDRHAVASGVVRRLTPIECERLQGFPDNHTQIPYRNKTAEQCPDGPRYAACGNSMAVPVMRWIGRRINEILKNESI